MKSMLYVGASLMIGASIYGFVDYKQTHNKKEFTEMYTDSRPVPAIAEKSVAGNEEKNEAGKTSPVVAAVSKKKGPAKVVNKEEVPVVKPIGEEEKIEKKEARSITETKVDVKTSPVTTVKKTKKKKKLDHRIFSRAPLREEMEEAEIDTVSNVTDRKTRN